MRAFHGCLDEPNAWQVGPSPSPQNLRRQEGLSRCAGKGGGGQGRLSSAGGSHRKSWNSPSRPERWNSQLLILLFLG